VAGSDDAETVAMLHADSWRRFYRGAYADSFLDGDLVADRRAVWSARLAATLAEPPTAGAHLAATPAEPPTAGAHLAATPAEPPAVRAHLAGPTGSRTLLAEDDAGPVGFAHVIFDADERWGSLVDNLHVTHSRRRGGIGTALLTRAAAAAVECATNPSLYLWVLEQNTEAQLFYASLGGTPVETADVPAPGGVPGRLNGSPKGLRIFWPDAALLAGHRLAGHRLASQRGPGDGMRRSRYVEK
jgi:GNAT superfamily N-acetyltransferase